MMLKRTMCILLTLAILLGTTSVSALDAYSLIVATNLSKKTDRRQVAVSLLAMVVRLSGEFPELKPSEKTWLQMEKSATDSSNDKASRNRLGQLIKSREYRHEQLQNLLGNIREALECAANVGTPTPREVMCWSVAGFNLTDDNLYEWVPSLSREGVLPRDLSGLGRDTNYGSYNILNP